jgi:hypothetical protein
MLTRYTGAEQTLADLRHYLLNRPGAMPSSHSQRYAQVVKTLCAGVASDNTRSFRTRSHSASPLWQPPLCFYGFPAAMSHRPIVWPSRSVVW